MSLGGTAWGHYYGISDTVEDREAAAPLGSGWKSEAIVDQGERAVE